jgi:hypothetical protein
MIFPFFAVESQTTSEWLLVNCLIFDSSHGMAYWLLGHVQSQTLR